MKDNVALSNGGRISGVNSTNLIISSIQLNDAGNYSAKATVGAGVSYSETAVIVVEHTVSVNLSTGFNLVPVAKVVAPFTDAEAMAQAVTNCSEVWRWDNASQQWAGHAKGGANNFTLRAGDCCFAKVTNAGQVRIPDPAVAATYNLSQGFNYLVNTQSPMTTANLLATSMPNCLGVWTWDPSTQNWSGHPKNGPRDFAISQGQPLMVWVSAPGNW
jgi:hypothetical protein